MRQACEGLQAAAGEIPRRGWDTGRAVQGVQGGFRAGDCRPLHSHDGHGTFLQDHLIGSNVMSYG